MISQNCSFVIIGRPTKKARKEPAASQVSSVCETYIEPSAIALYDYEPDTIDDLAFSVSGFPLFSFFYTFM